MVKDMYVIIINRLMKASTIYNFSFK